MGLDNLPDIMSVRQLAEFLQVSEITIKRALKSEKLKGLKIGRDWRIEKEKVIEWITKEKGSL